MPKSCASSGCPTSARNSPAWASIRWATPRSRWPSGSGAKSPASGRWWRRRTSRRSRQFGSLERRPDLRRDRDRLEAVRFIRLPLRPDADLVAFDGAHAAVHHRVADLEGLVVPLADAGLDHDLVAEFAGREETRLGLDDRQPDDPVFPYERIPVQAHRVEEEPRALIEPLEVVRIEDDLRGIGVAPVDRHVMAIDFHLLKSQALDYSAAFRRDAHALE